MLDELLNLRLCYEQFTPILLRLPVGLTPEEMQGILSYCMLSGINGIVAQRIGNVRKVLEITKGRIPVMGSSYTPEEAALMLQEGASLVELEVRPPVALKLLKNLEKKAKKHD